MTAPRTKKQDKPGENGQAEQQGGREVNLGKVIAKLTQRIGGLIQESAAMQVLIEEQDEMIAGLQAELVAATSGDASADR